MARIDHTTCTHLRTPAGRRACRNSSITVASIPAPDVAPIIGFSRIDALVVEITKNGQRVGTINKEERFEQIMIPGSRLAYAAQKRLVRYHVRLDTGAFPGSTYESRNDKIGHLRLTDAKSEAVTRINSF
jgi:hypothetical protein